jgi:hypothetical protein
LPPLSKESLGVAHVPLSFRLQKQDPVSHITVQIKDIIIISLDIA